MVLQVFGSVFFVKIYLNLFYKYFIYICLNNKQLKMESIKKIGIFVGVVGAIAVGYYLLKKTKPKVAEQQLSQLNADEKTSIEQDLFVPNSPTTPTRTTDTTTPTTSNTSPTRTPNTSTPTYTPTSTTTSTRSTTSTTPRTTTTSTASGRR